MAASQDPKRALRGRRQHSVAGTDPLYWARDDDRPTLEFPAAGPPEAGHDPGDATTVDLPAMPDEPRADIVDYRQPPEPAAGRGPLERRRYTGRHRPPLAPEPTRLGLSTAGMTVAIGILGAALTFLHTDATPSAQRARTPIQIGTPKSSAPGSEEPEAPSPHAAPVVPGATQSTATTTAPKSPAPAPSPSAGAPVQGVTSTGGGQDSSGGRPGRTPPRSSSSPRPSNPGKTGTTPPPQVLASCAPTTEPDGGGNEDPSAASTAPKPSATALTRLDVASASPTTAADPSDTPSPDCP